MEKEIMNAVKSLGTITCRKNEKEGTVAVQISKRRKLNGRRYKDWMKSLGKAKGSDPSIQKHSLLSQIEVNVTGPKDSGDNETTNIDSSPSRPTPERVEFRLRRVIDSGHAKRSDNPNLAAQTKKRKNNILESRCTMDESKLQEKFVQPFGEDCKSTTTAFVEYWVPVRLSNLQTEQYCGSLLSNSTVLCSSYQYNSMRILHEILVSTKKCCDHPYLVDRSLHTSSTEGIPQSEQLDAEIKLSSKLLLLHKTLLEINKRGLRVLVLYQSLGASEPVNTGDILDDIMHEKFGRDSFVRIDGQVSRSKRREILDSYNDKKGGKFVCLMETRSCVPSIKLKAIDTVIFFNSDWDPMNDFKALQKINLDSQFERVKVFRLYSAFTIEEKVLMLAKQGITPEGNIRNIKGSTCQELLTWGAYSLFQNLDGFHNISTTDTDSIVSHGNSFVEDVFHEMSILLPNNDKSTVHTKTSLILEVQQTEGVYPSNISLVGEVEYPLMDNFSVIEEMLIKEPPQVFWINILEGRKPRWKYLNSQSPRTRKSAQSVGDLPDAGIVASKKCRTEAESTPCQTSSMRTRNRRRSRDKERKLPAIQDELESIGESLLQTTQKASEDIRAPETCQVTHTEVLQSACKALEMELERLQKQKIEMTKQHEDLKLQTRMACEKEIDEIHKKYEIMLQNADMTFLEEEKVLETRHNKVLVNKELAEALMQRDLKNTTLSQVATKFAVEQAYRLISEWPKSSTVTRDEQESSKLSVGSPDVHVSASLREGCLRGPAPHLRRVGHSPFPQMPSERPTIVFSPVSLQQVCSSSLPSPSPP
ncbi:hypothetical protein C2S51_034098 [Perilla frutescens var. frutescens]|nr:hypothetical protein C2S51_034098 [Perilla frutescens var. frutescens]